jgi:excinuclease ABC subunit C
MRFADQLDIFQAEHSPGCLRAEVQKCLAPCAGRCTRTAYAAQVELAQRFLDGDAEPPVRILRQRLAAASAQLNFEYAAVLRDRIAQLEEASWELRSLRGTIEALSFVYEVRGEAGEDRAYIIRRGRIRAERPAPRTVTERAQLEAEAHRILARPEYQGGTVEPTQAAEVLLLARWFRLHPEERAQCWYPGGNGSEAGELDRALPGRELEQRHAGLQVEPRRSGRTRVHDQRPVVLCDQRHVRVAVDDDVGGGVGFP